MTYHTSASDKFALSNGDVLFAAMFRVLARYQRDGLKPGAERWQSDTRWSRPRLVEDIRAEWLSAVGDDAMFPWHDDYVLCCWVTLRKLDNEQKRSVCDSLGIDPPPHWAGARGLGEVRREPTPS